MDRECGVHLCHCLQEIMDALGAGDMGADEGDDELAAAEEAGGNVNGSSSATKAAGGNGGNGAKGSVRVTRFISVQVQVGVYLYSSPRHSYPIPDPNPNPNPEPCPQPRHSSYTPNFEPGMKKMAVGFMGRVEHRNDPCG